MSSRPLWNLVYFQLRRASHICTLVVAVGCGVGEAPSAMAAPQLDEDGVTLVATEDTALVAEDRSISVNAADRIIASYDMGGGTNHAIRKTGWGIARLGWAPFAENTLQPVLDAGFSRFALLMPFGQRTYVIDPTTGEASPAPGERLFQFDAYLDAQEQHPMLTADFAAVFSRFIAKNTMNGKLQEAIVYIGSPRLDADQRALIDTPDAWWERAYDVIVPLLDAGFRSIGFDASAPATPDLLDYELHEVLRNPELRDPVRDARLIQAIGDAPVEIYLEAVPYRASGRTDFPLYLIDSHWRQQDPERPNAPPAVRARFFEHDRFTGEVVRIVRSGQWRTEGIAPVEKVLSEGNTVAITPNFVLGKQHLGLDSLQSFIDMMDLPSLPTVVDLDPQDVNPDTAVYTITVGPQHGTLTPNRFHADVFTYTPDAYFTGVDSFEYVVRDESGGEATAVVKLFVNTELVVPPPAPSVPTAPPVTAPDGPPVAAPADPPSEPPAAPPSGPATPPSAPPQNQAPSEPGDADPGGPADVAPPVSSHDASLPPQQGTGGSATIPPSNSRAVPPATPPATTVEEDDPLPPSPPVEEPSATEPPPQSTAPPADPADDTASAGPQPGKGSQGPLPVPVSNRIGVGPPSGDNPFEVQPPQLAAADARRDPAASQNGVVVEKVRQLASTAPAAGGITAFISQGNQPDVEAFVFLPHENRLEALSSIQDGRHLQSEARSSLSDESEEWGLLAGVRPLQADHPAQAAGRPHVVSSVLQFLVSSIRGWLPH